MNKKEFIKSLVKTAKLAGVTYQELRSYLLETDEKSRETGQKALSTEKVSVKTPAYEIVYAGDVISTEHIAGKEIKGVIFVLKGHRVFVSARYAPKIMTKLQSKKYCAAMMVDRHHCTEGAVENWKKGGILFCNRRQINKVLKELGLEVIDNRWIWSSSLVYDRDGSGNQIVAPIHGDTDNVWGKRDCYVRPVCFLD